MNTKKRMEESGVDVLLITNPSNMYYLTGYNAWSFYVEQLVIVINDRDQPIWLGRYMDAAGAKMTTWMEAGNILSYPDDYVQSMTRHPMTFVADFLIDQGLSHKHIGVEMDAYFFSALSYEKLKQKLPDAHFKHAGLLVNELRMIKSDTEIEHMKKAGQIVQNAMYTAEKAIYPGARQCDAAAEIYYDLISGTPEFGGDYPAIVPMLPTGERTAAPHITWSDQPFKEGELVIVEMAGCYKRYHAPFARTISLGKPSEKIEALSKIVVEGLNAALDIVKPGVTCEEVESAWRQATSRYGIEKEARLGYSTGLSYPPDWGEHTASLRPGDQTVLQPNMTFHLIPALWFDYEGIEISETFRVTETGHEVLSHYTRDLIIKGDLDIAPVIS
ncbi:M24 family metallopeptidase [Lentibacillus saliphilus]|uniref:M24 family metallopeptidase n=1 Tax=Lentibacillus saliphilus TaxID=2737028 RepID=UPI001C30A3EE|nr:M24 family metallopeptidase [Lentibacillus saliphilus]